MVHERQTGIYSGLLYLCVCMLLMCVYVFMYCVYFLHVYIHVCELCIFMYVCVFMCMCIRVCGEISVYVCVHAHVHTGVNMLVETGFETAQSWFASSWQSPCFSLLRAETSGLVFVLYTPALQLSCIWGCVGGSTVPEL